MPRCVRSPSTPVVILFGVWLALASPPLRAAAQDAPATPSDKASKAKKAADEEYALKLYSAGTVAYDSGNYRQALDYFQEAYDLGGRADVLYDVGMTADRMQLDETALRAFVLYLQKIPDADNRIEVEQRITALQQVIATKHEQRREAAQEAHAKEPAPLAPEAVAASSQPAKPKAKAFVDPYDNEVDRDEDNLLTKWWLWTGIGVVVTATVVTVIAVSGGTETRTRDVFEGTSGKVVMTLQQAER